jgi:DNA (cytosine-5)-methyltransferase 1
MLQREGFVTVKEAAQLLDVAPNTVRAWGAAGSITEYRHPVNNYRLYKRSELESLLARFRHSPRATPKKQKPR